MRPTISPLPSKSNSGRSTLQRDGATVDQLHGGTEGGFDILATTQIMPREAVLTEGVTPYSLQRQVRVHAMKYDMEASSRAVEVRILLLERNGARAIPTRVQPGL